MSWLSRLWLAWMDRTDPAWAPTGIKRLHTGTDEAKAVASAKRAQYEAEQRRQAAVARSGVVKATASNVTPIGRKAAGR